MYSSVWLLVCKHACAYAACVRMRVRAYVCIRVKAMLTDCKSTDEFGNSESRMKVTYDIHRLVRGSYRAFPCDYFTLHIITSTMLEDKKKGTARERVWSKAQFSWRHRRSSMRGPISVFFHLPRKHVCVCACFFFVFFPQRIFSYIFSHPPRRDTTSLRNTRHYRDDAVIVRCEFRVRLFARASNGCRHLSIHSHLLSDVHWRHR